MRVVVDSGSTKSDWFFLNENNREMTSGEGLNPRLLTDDQILDSITSTQRLLSRADQVTELYFYGAGCGTKELCERMANVLMSVFKNAEVEVLSDVLGSARSFYLGKPLISCILGTGANACYYDGDSLIQNSPSLGFILGDEGSGAWFGKHLLRDFLYGSLPQEIELELKGMNLTKEVIIERVYKKSTPNAFLASMMPVLVQYKSTNYAKKLIQQGLNSFIEQHVLCYPESKSVEVNFVGSVAFFLKDELNEVCENKGITIGGIVQKPIAGLVNYHS